MCQRGANRSPWTGYRMSLSRPPRTPNGQTNGSQIGDHRLSTSCRVVERPDHHCGDDLVYQKGLRDVGIIHQTVSGYRKLLMLHLIAEPDASSTEKNPIWQTAVFQRGQPFLIHGASSSHGREVWTGGTQHGWRYKASVARQ